MKKAILAVLLLTVIAISTLSVVSAVGIEWTQDGVSGTWDSDEITDLRKNSTEVVSGFANFTWLGGVGTWDNDTEGIEFDQTINTLQGVRQWNWWNGVQRFYYAIEVLNSQQVSYFATVYQAHEQGIILTSNQVTINGKTPYRIWGQSIADLHTAIYHIQIYRVNSTCLAMTFTFPIDTSTVDNAGGMANHGEDAYTIYYTVDPTFFNYALGIKIYTGHDGAGVFDISFSETIPEETFLTPNTTGYDWDEQGEDWVLTIIQFLGFIQSLASLAFNAIQALFPIFPTIFFFWLLDATITSIDEGSVTPLGNAFRYLWEMLQQAGSVVVGFFQAIANLIPF